MTTETTTTSPIPSEDDDPLGKLIRAGRDLGGDLVTKRADRLRERYPEASDRELAERLVAELRRAAGTAGALTSVGGVLTLPITVPAAMLASWTFAVQVVLGVAHIYGYELDDQRLRFDVLAVLAANEVNQIFKHIGVEAAKNAAIRNVNKHITRETMKQVNRVVPRHLLTKAGEKSFTSFTKLAPLVGAPIGYAFESTFIKGVGAKAINWYEHGEDELGARLQAVA